MQYEKCAVILKGNQKKINNYVIDNNYVIGNIVLILIEFFKDLGNMWSTLYARYEGHSQAVYSKAS